MCVCVCARARVCLWRRGKCLLTLRSSLLLIIPIHNIQPDLNKSGLQTSAGEAAVWTSGWGEGGRGVCVGRVDRGGGVEVRMGVGVGGRGLLCGEGG